VYKFPALWLVDFNVLKFEVFIFFSRLFSFFLRNLEKKMARNGASERLLEQENNRLSDQLARKISSLKQISIEMKVWFLLTPSSRSVQICTPTCTSILVKNIFRQTWKFPQKKNYGQKWFDFFNSQLPKGANLYTYMQYYFDQQYFLSNIKISTKKIKLWSKMVWFLTPSSGSLQICTPTCTSILVKNMFCQRWKFR